VTPILREHYRPDGRPGRAEWERLSFDERLALPEPAGSIPRWALDPDFRRRQFVDVAARLEAEQGPAGVAEARAQLEREIQADQVLWERYVVEEQHRATA
jgi:hypothetical protein